VDELSSGSGFPFRDGPEESLPGLVHSLGDLIVAHRVGEFIKKIEGEIPFQVGVRVRQGLQLLVGRAHAGVGVSFLLLSLLVGVDLGEVAGSMEVEVGVEVLEAVLVDSSGIPLGNVCVAELLADDSAVLRLYEGIVVALTRARLGELDEELVEELGDDAVDELRAIDTG